MKLVDYKPYRNLLLRIGLACFTRLYAFIDVYSPDQEEVLAITFANDEDYMKILNGIEQTSYKSIINGIEQLRREPEDDDVSS